MLTTGGETASIRVNPGLTFATHKQHGYNDIKKRPGFFTPYFNSLCLCHCSCVLCHVVHTGDIEHQREGLFLLLHDLSLPL